MNVWRGVVKSKISAVKRFLFAIALIQLVQSFGPTIESHAQYKRITRGEPCPFDTCVAIHIQQYRRESAFMREMSALTDSQQREIMKLDSEIKIADSVANTYVWETEMLIRSNGRKDSTINILHINLANTHRVAVDAMKPPPWYERPGTWGIAGLIIGILITR